MPIYEYECTNCKHAFDVMQKMQDEPIKQCPECNKQTVVRLVSAAGFQLKGTGWYVTDFKDKGKPPAVDKKSTTTNADTTQKTEKPVTKTNSNGDDA